MDRTKEWYQQLRKPSFAPPSWVFGPVWSVLYLIIAVSFGFVAYQTYEGKVPLTLLVIFICNLITNFAYTSIQFRLRSLILASADILLVLLSLVISLALIYHYFPWITWINIPYLLWVSFATFLQLSITLLNKDKWNTAPL